MCFLPPPPLGGGSMHSVRSLPVLLRVVAVGGSRPPPCISSCLLRTRVVAVQPPPALRLSYGVYHASISLLVLFLLCTARSSLAPVPLAGSAASPPPRVLKDIKSALKR